MARPLSPSHPESHEPSGVGVNLVGGSDRGDSVPNTNHGKEGFPATQWSHGKPRGIPSAGGGGIGDRGGAWEALGRSDGGTSR